MNANVFSKSDLQLQNDVTAELKWEPSLNATQVGVEVKDGIVTLAGHVDSFAEKWAAESATQRVSGVKGLAVEMEVTLPGSSIRNDADIAHAAENVLQWSTNSPNNAVKVMVENGWVTLTGSVEWDYQRLAAAEAVRYLLGVSGLSDQITLKPKVAGSSVKFEIEAALDRRAKSDAQDISVEVEGGNVTLSGVVNSWNERQLARNSAWGTPGVHNVIDNMTVAY